jgi:hypothetical protein
MDEPHPEEDQMWQAAERSAYQASLAGQHLKRNQAKQEDHQSLAAEEVLELR